MVSGSGSTLNISNNSEDAYHVVVISCAYSSTTGVKLDGFTITGGNANGNRTFGLNSNGVNQGTRGGINIQYGNNTISNNIFSGNAANSGGGGISTSQGTNTISNNTFSGNNCTNSTGGGLYTISSTSTISNNIFSGNAANSGGGLYTYNSTSTISNNIFSGNATTSNGGGLYTTQGHFTISNNIFSGNAANSGGGSYTDGDNTNTISNNTFSGNNCTNYGGGLYTYYAKNTGNIVGVNSPNISNNIFWGNTAAMGGADYSSQNNNNNNTFQNNLLQGAQSSYTSANNNDLGSSAANNIFNTDPLFVNANNPAGPDGIYRTADDGLELQSSSPAINTGDSTLMPSGTTTDITGGPRVIGSNVDMGAYEYHFFNCPGGVTLYVDSSVASSGNGTSWATAYKTLDEALYAAWNCTSIDTINVAKGTYKPTKKPYNNNGTNITTTAPRDVTFHLRDSLTVLGGYPTGGGTRNAGANVTILSGDLNGNDVVSNSGGSFSISNNGENAYHVVLINCSSSSTTGVKLDGFTVTEGYAFSSSTVTINGNLIYRQSGAGIYANNGNNTISNNNISLNTVLSGGGGLYAINSKNTISNNIFWGNFAVSGGGLYAFFGTDTISNNIFWANRGYSGGGLNAYGSNNTISNNTLSRNSATTNGGGLYIQTLSVNSNTISNNIFWKNTLIVNDTTNTADFYSASTTSTFKNNLLQLASSRYSSGNNNILGTGATGNIFATDPLFVNAATPAGPDGIYRTADDGLELTPCSPAINKGNNSLISPANTITDITGAARIANTTVDMGAYEYQAIITPIPAGANTIAAAQTIAINTVPAPLTGSAAPAGDSRTYSYTWQISTTSATTGFTTISGANSQNYTPTTALTDTVWYRRLADAAGACTDTSAAIQISTGSTCPGGVTLYVDSSRATSGNGTSWATAYKTLDEALQAAWNCTSIDSINVAKGTYKPTQLPYNNDGTHIASTDPRDITFHLRDSLTVLGGYPTGGGTRNAGTNPTILSGDLNGDDVVNGSGSTLSFSNNGEDAYHVVLISCASSSTTGVKLDGFTVTGGNVNGSSSLTVNTNMLEQVRGAGIYAYYGNNTINNNIFTGNNATYGGALNGFTGNNTISNNTFSKNNAGATGGGFYLLYGTNTISNNTFLGNASNNLGGGGYTFNTTTTISNNTFSGNNTRTGGGLYVGSNSPNITYIISNNTFSGNSASAGGGLYTSGGNNTISNNIFWNNQTGGSATTSAADYVNGGNATNTFKNNLLQLAQSSYTTAGDNSAHDLGSSAANNIFAQDPLFVNAANPAGPDGIYRTADDGLALGCNSPALDAGDNSLITPAYVSGTSTDITGAPRVQGIKVDMGAYEGQNMSASGTLATAYATATTAQTGTINYGTCSNLIATLQSTSSSPVSGSVTANVWIDAVQSLLYVKRHYQLTPAINAAAATGTITLYFTDAEFNAYNTQSPAPALLLPQSTDDATTKSSRIGNIIIQKRSGTSSDNTGSPDSYSGSATTITSANINTVWDSTLSRWELTFNTTGFSGFWVTTLTQPLPVTLLSFTGSKQATGNQLQWQTANEVNTKTFELQSSTSSSTGFTAIANIAATGNGANRYSYTDSKSYPVPTVYYRLKMIDANGQFSYSPIIYINNNNASANAVNNIYPNPARDRATLSIGNSQLLHTTANLYDAGGKLIQVISITNLQQPVYLNNLAAGIYTLRLKDGTALKVVKE